MKKTILTATIAFAAIFGMKSQAQDQALQFGVKAGVNLSNFTGDYESKDAKVGFNAGLTVDYALSPEIYLLSGLEFTTKGAKFKDEDNASVTANSYYLQLPIHLGYKFKVADDTKLVLHAGPYLAYGVGGKIKTKLGSLSTETDFFEDGVKRFDAGLGLGAGVEFGKFSVGLGYDFGLTKLADGDGSPKNMNASLSVGYKF